MFHVEHVAKHMRQADRNEVWASNHLTPEESLRKSVDYSIISRTALADGEPVLIAGMAPYSILDDSGLPWMLATDGLLDIAIPFLKRCRQYVAEMLTFCNKLENWVHVDNEISIRWLAWMGFNIDDPAPHGIEKDLFHRFWMTKEA